MIEHPSDPLEQRLADLAATGSPDWADVERRSRRQRPTADPRRALLLAAAAVVLFAAAAAASGLASRVLDLLTVSHSREEVPRTPTATYVFGDRLNRPAKPPLGLAASLLAPLLGQDVALAVGSPDGRFVAYHAWRQDTPYLRLVDLRSGRDTLLQRGAQSVAWADRLAYVRGAHARWRRDTAYVGHVVVAERPGGRVRVWTDAAARYRVVAWAGRVLLVAVDSCDVPPCLGKRLPEAGIYALRAPDRLRRLSLGAVSAVAPDGRLVIGPGTAVSSSIVRVEEARSGRTVASLDLSRALTSVPRERDVPPVLGAATWRGDMIVAVVSSGAVPTLVVLRFGGRALRLDRVLRMEPPARGASWFGVHEPTFVGRGTARIVAHVRAQRRDGSYLSAILTCDLTRRACVRGPALPARRWLALVTNPSRPVARLGGRR